MNNAQRCDVLARNVRAPKFKLGELVKVPDGTLGRIDVIYADYQAALDSFTIKPGWYEMLVRTPKTSKASIWYGVVLVPAGAALTGEDDLEVAP